VISSTKQPRCGVIKVASADGRGTEELENVGGERLSAGGFGPPLWSAAGQQIVARNNSKAYLRSITEPTTPKTIRVGDRPILGIVANEGSEVEGMTGGDQNVVLLVDDPSTYDLCFVRYDLETDTSMELWRRPFWVGSDYNYGPPYATGAGILLTLEDTQHPPHIELVSADYRSEQEISQVDAE
jgi:hypothetical protein